MGVTYCPGITIRSKPGIPLDVRQSVGGLVRYLRATQRIPHGVILNLAAEPVVGGPSGGSGFAMFTWFRGKREPGSFVWIVAAGGMVEWLTEEHAIPRDEAIDLLLESILHEWAHYEHWRNGRPEPTERGVNLRARNLLRAYKAAAAPPTEEHPDER